jgi:hypothetical protein
MHRRRRDALGRFLPTIPFLDNNLKLAYNLFKEEGYQEINPFALIHQAPMAHNPPNRPPAFEFPIIAQQENDNLKNIPSSLLLKFYGLVSEDPKNFLFEFDILCCSCDYTLDTHRLKLFLAMLKEGSLRWFMSLGRGVVDTWATMQTKFLEKYKEYYKSGSKGDEIFRIQ